MHKVKRNLPPSKLVTKDIQWREQLIQNPNAEHGWENLNRELRKEIIDSLRNMYKGCCCYCEEDFESNSYATIEHFKPKRYFKELCYDYNNMHYCCPQCNTTKGDTFSDAMFSPSEEDPDIYIEYRGFIAEGKDSEGRGMAMIDVLGLNEREFLRNKRAKYYNDFYKNYGRIKKAIEELKSKQKSLDLVKQLVESFIADIEEKSQEGEKYCTMIKHNFSVIAEKLKKLNCG